MKYIDLTHTITDAMPVFPGDPKVSLKQTVFLEKDGNNDHTLTTNMHIGTHMDAPLHMLADGKYIDALSPEQFFGKGIIVDARGKKEITAELLENVVINEGTIVLILTGCSDNFTTENYFHNYPEIADDFAQKMIEQKVKIVGIDAPSPDKQPPWKTHKTLLRNNIMILENLTNLDQLVNVKNFEVIALPAKLHTDGAPVRVIVKTE